LENSDFQSQNNFLKFYKGSILRLPKILKITNLGMKNSKKVRFFRSTLTISSTFPQFHSKMSLLSKKIRKSQ